MISNKKTLKFTQNDRKFQKVGPKSCEKLQKLQTQLFHIPDYNGVANSSSFQTVPENSEKSPP